MHPDMVGDSTVYKHQGFELTVILAVTESDFQSSLLVSSEICLMSKFGWVHIYTLNYSLFKHLKTFDHTVNFGVYSHDINSIHLYTKAAQFEFSFNILRHF